MYEIIWIESTVDGHKPKDAQEIQFYTVFQNTKT